MSAKASRVMSETRLEVALAEASPSLAVAELLRFAGKKFVCDFAGGLSKSEPALAAAPALERRLFSVISADAPDETIAKTNAASLIVRKQLTVGAKPPRFFFVT